MLSLKKLHESLIQQEIKQNYFLYTLNEAVKKGTVDELSGLLSEIGNLIDSTNIKSLKTALTLAQADSKRVPRYTDSREAEKAILKIITFYSKIWNFFNQDMNKIIANLGSFHKNDKALNTSNAADFIKRSILRLIIEDDSPWYKKALSTITNDISFTSEIPYLNIASFVDELMNKTKEELSNMILVATRVSNPSDWHNRISTSILASDTGEKAKSSESSTPKDPYLEIIPRNDTGERAKISSRSHQVYDLEITPGSNVPKFIPRPANAPAATTTSPKTVPIPLTVLRKSSSPPATTTRPQRVEMPTFDLSQLSPEQRANLSTSPVSVQQVQKEPSQTVAAKPQTVAARQQRVEMPAVDPTQLTKSVKTQPGFAQLPTEEPGQTVQKIRRKTTTVLEAKLLKKIKQKLKVYQ